MALCRIKEDILKIIKPKRSKSVHDQKLYKNSMPQTIAFYNLENFFDTVDDPDKNDDDFLPNGTNHWTENRYLGKIQNKWKLKKGCQS